MARDPGLSKSLDWFIDGPQPMKWRDVATMVLAVVVPPAVAVWFFGVAGMAAFAASMPAHLASREGGGLVALLATMTTGLAGMVAIGDPVMALLVAGCLSVMTAIASHHQLARPAMRALLTWTLFTAPIIPDDNLPQLFVLYLAGMVWSVSVTVLLGRAGTPAALTAQSRVYSVTFGVVFGIGLVSAVWLGGQLFDDHGFWLPLTFVILSMPPYGAVFSRSLKRTLATLVGALASVALSQLSPPTAVTVLLAVAAFPLAFRFIPRSSFIGVTLLTFTILEALSMISDVDMLAEARIETVILASLMTLVLGLVAAGVLAVLKPNALREITSPNQ